MSVRYPKDEKVPPSCTGNKKKMMSESPEQTEQTERARLMHRILDHEHDLDDFNDRIAQASVQFGRSLTYIALDIMTTLVDVSYLLDDEERVELMRRALDCQRAVVLLLSIETDILNRTRNGM